MTSIKKMKIDHLIGMEVGTATLLKEIARGGMAVVFLAYQRTLKRQIAVKVLPKSLISKEAAERFQQEAEAAAILAHPNIVQIYEVGDTADFLFFTMQLINGLSLSQYLKSARKHVLPSKRILPVAATLKIIIKVLDGLDYAHRQDTIHRDIKPANILIEADRKRPIITDFGIAKVSHGVDDSSAVIRGTPVYMAPEQILNREIDGRADIYSAGTMLFEMLVSNLPLPRVSSSAEMLKAKIKLRDNLYMKRPSEINPNVGPELDELVFKAISFHPENRFATCRDFFESLEGCLDRYLKKGT